MSDFIAYIQFSLTYSHEHRFEVLACTYHLTSDQQGLIEKIHGILLLLQ